MVDILSRTKVRRGTAAQASTYNEVLAEGQIGITIDNNVQKVGDGITPWNTLPIIGQALLARINTWTQAQTWAAAAIFNAAVTFGSTTTFTGAATHNGATTFNGLTTHTDDVVITGDDSLFQGSNQESESYYSTAGDKLITKAKAAATWWSQRFSNFEITNFDNTKSFIRGIVNAQVELFHNGVKKLETDASGVTVTGRLVETARAAEKWHSVVRTAGTWYQNTTGRMIRVAVINESSGTTGSTILHVNDTPAANAIGYYTSPGNGIGWRAQLYADVPPGHYYMVENFNGASIFRIEELS